MIRIVMVRPGATDFDEQKRIIGTLDLPLSAAGEKQALDAAVGLQDTAIQCVYYSSCQSAQKTAEIIADKLDIKAKELAKLVNLDHGLWHGKLIEEVRQRQPKVYRQWQKNPASVCPPEGEPLSVAQDRVMAIFGKLLKRHNQQTIAVVCPEPLASVAIAWLRNEPVGDLWEAECRCGSWDVIDVEPASVTAAR
ncbi:MAG: Phosphoserine phosphatase 1 [Planctomycetota bacterium]